MDSFDTHSIGAVDHDPLLRDKQGLSHKPLIQRIDYLSATAMLLVTMLLLFASAWKLSSPQQTQEALTQRAGDIAVKQCTASLDALSLPYKVISSKPHVLQVSHFSQESLPSLAMTSSAAQLGCPGLEVVSACIGATCKQGAGAHITLATEKLGG